MHGPVYYPAAYDNYVIAVAATDYNDVRASFSNFGAEIDVAAPGVRILSRRSRPGILGRPPCPTALRRHVAGRRPCRGAGRP